MSSFCNPDIIKVSPDRFRIVTIDDPAVLDIAESIEDIGQLQAILVSRDMELRDGLNRLMACKRLNRDVWFITEEEGNLTLDNPSLVKVAEFQANFKRTDFTPAQRNKAIAEIDTLMRSVYGSKKTGPGASEGWTMADTAKKLGLKSHRPVSEAILVTRGIELGIKGVAEAKTTQEQVKMVKTFTKLESAKELAKRQRPTVEIEDPFKWFSSKIILGDCLERMKQLSAGVCNLFVTDPPWNIKADKMVKETGSAVQKATGGYDDSSEAIIPLVKAVAEEMSRVGKPDCYVVMFCGIKYWYELAEHFRSLSFQVYNKPLVWVKATIGSGLCSSRSPAPSMWPASVTDFMLLARKGNAALSQLHKGDAFICPPISTADRIHQAQKPIPLMEEIIGRFFHPGTNPVLIDCFAGSGSTLVAARRVGIKQYFGYELDKTNRERAVAFLVNQYVKEQEYEAVAASDAEEFE